MLHLPILALFSLSLLVGSSMSVHAQTRFKEVTVQRGWLKGVTDHDGTPQFHDLGPAMGAHNTLVERVAKLEQIVKSHDGIQENISAKVRTEESARKEQLVALRDELCKAVGEAQDEICKDIIFLETIQDLISKSVKSEIAKLKQELNESKEQNK